MPTPLQNSQHFNRIEQYARAVDALYQQAIKEATLLGANYKYNPDIPFSFDNFPATKARLDKIIKTLFTRVEMNLISSTENEWNFSNAENDALVRSVFKDIPEAELGKYMNRNLEALKVFQQRKHNGMNLSERVWSLKDQFKQELEMSIDVGLSEGKSAAELSRDVRQYLNDPEKLFRRVRDYRGVLQLSKNAAAYHPGQGRYRSSYKNAMRMTRTEVNMAYRASDHQRIQQLDFIVGIEVKLSNNHPVNDICDDLKGKYPKQFKFSGWHPLCRCHMLTILASKEEVLRMTDNILAGKDPWNVGSINTVKDVPPGFNGWIKDNKERANGWNSQPYFIRDNFKNGKISGGLSLGNIPTNSAVKINTPVQQPSNPKVFIPAKTIKDAEQYAKGLLADNVSYKGVSVNIANQWNESIFNHVTEFPELRGNIQFIGTIQERNLFLINARIEESINQNDTLWQYCMRLTNGNTEESKKKIASAIRSKLGRVERTTMAESSRTSHVKGVSINSNFFKDEDLAQRNLDYCVKSKYHPEGCNTVKSVIDHEMGHELDKLLSLRNNHEILKLYNENYVNIKDELSGYGKTKIGEFIAEAWSEYMNNPKPRPLAKKIGDIIKNEYTKFR